MWVRAVSIALCVMCVSSLSHAKEERWYNFAEDGDVRYYIDQKSIVSRSEDVHIFWVKSVPKRRDYFKEEYNLNNLAFILTSYEMDCSDATYRVRQTVMMDKNRRELNKSVPSGAETDFEPIPPESSLELAQDMVCSESGSEDATEPKGGATTAKPASKGAPPKEEGGEEPATEEPEGPAPSIQ